MPINHILLTNSLIITSRLTILTPAYKNWAVVEEALQETRCQAAGQLIGPFRLLYPCANTAFSLALRQRNFPENPAVLYSQNLRQLARINRTALFNTRQHS